MQYRTLGRTQLRVSEIGYGGGRVHPDSDEGQLIRMLHHAFDLGLNYIDTAPTYGGGASETIIGKAIKGRREGCIVATKTEAFDPQGIIADVEGSLKRLQTAVIDILQFHGGWFSLDDGAKILEQGGLETYQKLRDQGVIRFLGFSADGPSAGVERLLSTGEFDMIQIHYNLMYQSTCDAFSNQGIMPDAEEHGMGIALMRSTTSGAFPKLMRQCFPQEMEGVDLEGFLLNYVLSNPLVDVALMSLQTLDDVAWTNAVSDGVSARLNLREIHRR
ncbi:aldo/keto reductase, partial [Candidatus Poribacteria bacterium]|nr:aldo/keto reductase [Candidatus Poribacteria bacterium]